ncbi:MAG: Ig-like domain-containing protein [Candidatus Kapaibacterium sp.]
MMKRAFFFLIAIIIYGCANTLQPPGGPPDKTPPEVLEVNPAQDSTNYAGEKIKFKFSKYMNRSQVLQSISSMPEIKYKSNWSGKDLELEIAEPLDSNTTYVVQLGSGYTDYYGNKPNDSYTLVFSTGSMIDTGRIEGRLFDEEPAEVSIFAYRIDNINPDTLDISKEKPRYFTETGTNGSFTIRALKDGTYRIFAVRDKFDDRKYDPSIDGIGTAFRDALVDNGKSEVVPIKVGPPRDKLRPELLDARSMNSRFVKISFSEVMADEGLQGEAFRFGAEGRSIDAIAAYKDANEGSKVFVISETPLDSGLKWTVHANTSMVKDSAGNMLSDTSNSAEFKVSLPGIEVPAEISSLPFKDSTRKVDPYINPEIVFSIPPESPDGIIYFTRLDTALKVDFDIVQIRENMIQLRPYQRLANDAWHRIEIDMRDRHAITGKAFKDTVYKMDFLTSDLRNTGSVSGSITNRTDCRQLMVILKKNGEMIMKAPAGQDGSWEFKEVEPGSYLLEVFCDENNDGEYNYGNAMPFEHSEPFIIYDEELNLRPRWSVEDVKLWYELNPEE